MNTEPMGFVARDEKWISTERFHGPQIQIDGTIEAVEVPTIAGPDWKDEFTTSCAKHAWGTYTGTVAQCAAALFNHTVQYHAGEQTTYNR
jgi:hypothetical protein